MSYNTIASFTSGSFTTTFAANVDPGIIQMNLDLAQNIIDSSLASHFNGVLPIPASQVPPLVLSMERDIAAYYLWQQMGVNPGSGTAILQQRFDMVMGDGVNPASGILGQLRYGKMKLMALGDTVEVKKTTSVGVSGQTPRNWQQGCGVDKGRIVY